jgi:regulator of sigma E protease
LLDHGLRRPSTGVLAMSWFLAFAGFAALIILHEAGHFAAAKAVGMRVERFMLFFPPILTKVRRGETEYGVGAIPLGGYVKITGMSPHEDIPPEHQHRAYLRQPVWKRIVVISAGPAMNVLIAFVLLWGVVVANGVPRNALAVAGTSDGPAQSVLREGDRILAIGGVRGDARGLTGEQVRTRQRALRAAVNRHRCPGRPADGCRAATPVRVTVLRDGRRVTFAIRPIYDAPSKRMILGFFYGDRENVGPAEAARVSVDRMWAITTATVDAITRIFYDPQARKEVSGVVGSYEVTRQSIEFDTEQAIIVLALISLSLAVVNLFPFLPLDGGHIFWALAEKIRGRPIPYSLIERASVVGFLLVAFLFITGLSNDIGRLRGEGFGVR